MRDTPSALQMSIHLLLSANLLSNLVDKGHSAETGFEPGQLLSNTYALNHYLIEYSIKFCSTVKSSRMVPAKGQPVRHQGGGDRRTHHGHARAQPWRGLPEARPRGTQTNRKSAVRGRGLRTRARRQAHGAAGPEE